MWSIISTLSPKKSERSPLLLVGWIIIPHLPQLYQNVCEYLEHNQNETYCFSIGQVETNPFSHWSRKITCLFPIGWEINLEF